MVRLFTVCLVVLTFFVAELKGFTDDNKEVRDEYVKWRKFLRRNMEGDNAGPVMNGKTFGTMLGQFSGRVSKLSRFTKMAGGKFKFLLVGACDGDGEYDPHLNMFYSSIHWQGTGTSPLSYYTGTSSDTFHCFNSDTDYLSIVRRCVC
mgnify:CR=1 FL=1